MTTLTFVDGDDWCGLYLDGGLIHQGHELSVRKMFYYATLHGPIESFEALDVDTEWLEEIGQLPDNLSDVRTR